MTTDTITATPPTIVMVPPGEIIIDANVRTSVDLDPGFVNSIRERGIITEPIGWQDDDGLVHVVIGQRRVRAAAQLELAEIPVKIRSRHDAEADRVVDQLIENDRRNPLTEAERLSAWSTLFELGMSADEVAKRTGSKRDSVRAAVKLTKEAPQTVATIEAKQLTLDDALMLAEFEDDPIEREQLEAVLLTEPHRAVQVLGDLRYSRDRRLEYERLAVEAQKLDVEWANPDVVNRWNSPYARLESVRIGKATKPPTVEEAKEQGGLVASAIETSAWKAGVLSRSYQLGFWIVDPKEHGYKIPRAGSMASLSEEQQEQRRKERAEKRERRQAWAAACEQRQTWIRDSLLTAKTAPEGALLWVVKTLLGQRDAPDTPSDSLRRAKIRELALAWFGKTTDAEYWERELPELMELAKQRPGQSEIIVGLAYSLACSESWISDPKSYDYGEHRGIGAYLRQLAAWGYTLSTAEEKLAAADPVKPGEA